MKKNKGFTLIELLAVIVILAIIALIAVPVILNIIDKANKSAFKDTAYGIVNAAELYFAEQQLDLNGMSSDATFTFPNDIGTLEVKGQVPDGTVLKVNTQGKVALAMQNGRYCITKGYSDTDVTVSEDVENCNIPSGEGNTGGTTEKTLTELAVDNFSVSNVGDPAPTIVTKPLCLTDGTTCEPGTPVAIKVNNDKTYRFYVIEEKDNKVTLIMDRNLGDTVAWYYSDDSDNSHGPTTAIAYLNDLTDEEWSNIPKKAYTYSGIAEDGETRAYEDITETMRVRMITYEEATEGLGCTLVTGNCPSWLYANLDSDSNTSLPYGYWTSTAYASTSYNAWRVYYYGSMDNNIVYSVGYIGVRPVIELSK